MGKITFDYYEKSLKIVLLGIPESIDLLLRKK